MYGALPSTLDVEWQCTARRSARSLPSGSVRRTATRPRTYRTHCHSPLIVPIRYARCRVAVRAALPLAPDRTVPYVHHRVAVYGALPSTFTDEWQCTVCRQVRVINVFHMLADLLGGHPGPGAGEPRVGGRRQSPAWRSARPAGTQGASLARAVSGSAWPHASAQAISPLDLRNESSRNASPNDTASAVPAARALRLLGPPRRPAARARTRPSPGRRGTSPAPGSGIPRAPCPRPVPGTRGPPS